MANSNSQVNDFFTLPKPRGVEKVLKQTGKLGNVKRDAGRPAKLPGKRISASGKVYWETRKNRSDAPLKSV